MFFGVQIEFYHLDDNDNKVLAYSDYGNPNAIKSGTGTQFNMTGLNLHESGTKIFDLSSYGDQRWSINFDFMSNGEDTAGQINQNSIPEPTTMLLLGVGLLGIAGVSRRRNK